MKLALHHFRKEARHLLPRWWPWLGLLTLELLLNLGWLWPRQDTLAQVMPFLTWVMALWLTASFSPDDSPASVNRFSATRPLPAASFHFGRVLQFMVMVVLPLAIQELLYLSLLGREPGMIFTGTCERVLLTVAALGWWLPFSTLARGKDSTILLLAVILSAALPLPVIEFLLLAAVNWLWPDGALPVWLMPLPADLQGMTCLALAFIGGLSLLAWCSRTRQWHLRWRIIALAALTLPLSFLLLFWPLPRMSQRTREPALVASLEKEVLKATARTSAMQSAPPYRDLVLSAEPELPPLPPGVTAETDLTSAWMTLPEGTVEARTDRGWPNVWSNETSAAALQAFYPSGTLFRALKDKSYHSLFGSFHLPAGWNVSAIKPSGLDGEVEGHFARWEYKGELPVREGAAINLPDVACRIQAVHHELRPGMPVQPGTLLMTLELEFHSPLLDASPWGWPSQWVPMLHLPGKQLVWADPEKMQSTTKKTLTRQGLRGAMSSWQRGRIELDWPGVLDAKGGIKSADLGGLKLVLLHRTYAGQAHWKMHVPKVTVVDNSPRAPALSATLPQPQIADWLRALPPLPASATTEEARARWALLLHRSSMAGENEAVDWSLCQDLKTLAKKYPDLLFNTRTGLAQMRGKRLNAALAAAFDESQRDVVIDHLVDRPWVADIVAVRGWEPLARRTADALIHSSMGDAADRLAMLWKAPEDVPALVERATRNSRLNPDLFDYLQGFPDSQAPLQAALSQRMKRRPPIVDDYLDLFQQDDRELVLALEYGVPEALTTTLHLARVLTMTERKTSGALVFLTRLPALIRLLDVDTGRTPRHGAIAQSFFDRLAAKRADQFHYDAAAHQWIEIAPSPKP